MLDPERHDLPEVVLGMMAVIEESMRRMAVSDPVTASRQLSTQILKMWGGIQAYIAPPTAKVSPRFIEEVRVWAEECLAALGHHEEVAAQVATQVAADLRQHFAGVVLYLPKDRWTFRTELNRLFNGHNQVELCRKFGLTTATLYKLVWDERNGKSSKAVG